LKASLEHLNPFLAKRVFEKSANLLILDMKPNQESEYKHVSLRTLLSIVNVHGDSADRSYFANPVHYRDLRRMDFNMNPVESKCNSICI
jgi:hypothetical protein